MNSKELRQNFIDYFSNKRGHSFIRSSTVVPIDDPTLLFTNAGMNQFKDIFLDKVPIPKDKRVVNSQKCIRVSGKHNDLEEVGVDNYHHTFFEMLGNWSFGDYYKEDAILWAWDYLTNELNLDKNRLWVTVYKDDDESETLWKDLTDIDHTRVLKFGDKDNFWEMGDTGPCGPCTEIHYFIGDNIKDQNANGVNSDELYREIWNLVFIQYNRQKNGDLIDLPVKHVDTGMGLERVLSTLNDLKDHYQTDLFKPIIEEIEKLTSIKCIGDEGVPHRVIADHLRMLSFSIADGAMPSNEGRGYVIRRVLRRASRYGKLLGLNEPFIFKLVKVLCDIMGDAYPELTDKRIHIEEVIKSEESSFLKTIDKGMTIFEEMILELSEGDVISGQDAFKLYDTYGFPLDLTELLANEKGMSVDSSSFADEMNKQRERARKSGKFIQDEDETEWIVISSDESSEFLGYQQYTSNSKILKYRESSGYFQYILDKTPFYAESGGQIGDMGKLKADNYSLNIIDTIKVGNDIIHISEDFNENLVINNSVQCSILSSRRDGAKANHSATHLLHAALKNILGDHVQQAGSLVSDDRLRFDLTHYSKISKEQIEDIENLVNKKIQEGIILNTSIQLFEEAKQSGAVAMFNEKYDDKVRVVDVPGFSKELCGGTHVSNTIEICLFKIISESSLSKGVRRIEAITGKYALNYLLKLDKIVSDIKDTLKCADDDLLDRFQSIYNDSKLKTKEIDKLNNQNQSYRIKDLIDKSDVFNGVRIIISKENGLSNIKEFGDRLREQLNEKFIAVIGSVFNNKPILMCINSKELEDIIPANLIISKIAPVIGGGGGGKKNIATAGGKDMSKVDDALQKSAELIKETLGG